jgi:hypothetical protein
LPLFCLQRTSKVWVSTKKSSLCSSSCRGLAKAFSNFHNINQDAYTTIEEKKFVWLLEHLLPPNEKIKGCELVFPDSVFFSKGKPKFVVKSDRDNCLSASKTS